MQHKSPKQITLKYINIYKIKMYQFPHLTFDTFHDGY